MADASIAAIAMKYKNTHDLAGVAESLRDSVLRKEFHWSEGSGNAPFDVKNLGELYECRKMNCYEFVEFCAFLCGPQLTIGGGHEYGAGVPLLKVGDSIVFTRPVVTIPGASIATAKTIKRGALVLGVRSTGNNTGGFFHIGIATKATEVVHLTNAGLVWSDDLKSGTLVDWFSADKYPTLWLAAYNWKSTLGDSYSDPLPTWS
jgi:hypothetical protein